MSASNKVTLKDLQKNKKIQTKVQETASPDREMSEVKFNQKSFDSGKRHSKVQEFESHLYRLEAAEVLKQTGPNKNMLEDPDSWTKWAHAHPVRTRDSEGRPVERSSSIAGHFHFIEWGPNPKGDKFPPIPVKMSGPMTMAAKKVGNKSIMQAVPVNDWDDHTHEVTYLRTDMVKARHTNVEAQKVVAYEAQKGLPPKGAMEGASKDTEG